MKEASLLIMAMCLILITISLMHIGLDIQTIALCAKYYYPELLRISNK